MSANLPLYLSPQREKVAEDRMRGQRRKEYRSVPPQPGPLPQGEGTNGSGFTED